MTAAPRYIDYLPLDDLVPADWNPKNHHPDIGVSLDRFGSVESIAIDERTGRLVAGHGRLDEFRAKRDAGAEPPEGVIVEDGMWRIPVQRGWASTDDDEARAYLVASNATSEAGGWDMASLYEGLDALSDLSGTSFASLDALVGSTGQSTSPEREWADAGMPSFDQPDRQSAYSTHVHFPTQADAERFFTDVLKRPRYTRSIWWPQSDGHVGSDQTSAYVSDAEPT